MSASLDIFGKQRTLINRRQWGQWATTSFSGLVAMNAMAHNSAGWVKPPKPVANFQVSLIDGRQIGLRELLRGRVTALQVMFTGCSSTCPIQGALFSQIQGQMEAAGSALAGAQLVSVSMDPLGDSLQAMSGWLRQFGANGRWRGVVPLIKDVDALLDFLDGKSKGLDRHTAQVFMFNAHGELALRSVDFPPPAEVIRWMSDLVRADHRRLPVR